MRKVVEAWYATPRHAPRWGWGAVVGKEAGRVGNPWWWWLLARDLRDSPRVGKEWPVCLRGVAADALPTRVQHPRGKAQPPQQPLRWLAAAAHPCAYRPRSQAPAWRQGGVPGMHWRLHTYLVLIYNPQLPKRDQVICTGVPKCHQISCISTPSPKFHQFVFLNFHSPYFSRLLDCCTSPPPP